MAYSESVVENGLVIRESRPLTVRDLDDMPDDGNRHELIEGELFVSGVQTPRHQEVIAELLLRLRAVRPPHMAVMSASAVRLSLNTEVQPDVLVAPFRDFGEKNLPVPPALAVEVLSPASSSIDLHTKKRTYERFGVPDYWVIDPLGPSLVAFELDKNGHYQTIAKLAGRRSFEATQPFPVRIVPNELLGGFADR